MKPKLKTEPTNQISHENALSDVRLPSGGLYFQIVRGIFGWLFRLYFRLEFIDFKNVPKQGPFIVSPNHQSYFDPFWVSIPFPYPLRYMTWDRFIYMPLIGHFIRTLGAFPVKIDKGDRAALRLSLEHLKSGGALMIFPEGGRTRDGELMPFKPGVIRLAMEAKVPIVPVTVIGGYEAYNPHHWFPRPHKVKVKYHPPIYLPCPPPDTDLKDFLTQQAQRLQGIIEDDDA